MINPHITEININGEVETLSEMNEGFSATGFCGGSAYDDQGGVGEFGERSHYLVNRTETIRENPD